MSNPTTSTSTTSPSASLLDRAEIRDTGTPAGQGVFALRDLEVGDTVIAVDKPVLSALDSDELEGVCYECLRPKGLWPMEIGFGFRAWLGRGTDVGQVALQRCAGCKVVWYCSKACQKSSWSSHHSRECRIFKRLYPRILSGSARAVLRFMLLDEAKKIDQQDWIQFMSCHCPIMKWFQEDKIQELMQLKQIAETIAKVLPFEADEKIAYGHLIRLKINGVTLQTPFHDPLGVAMHPLLAKVNHSCDPNCYVRFPGPNPTPKGSPGANPGEIVVTPMRSIKRGEEITIVYTDETDPVRWRQAELEESYFFTCKCTKCVREEAQDNRVHPSIMAKIIELQEDAAELLAKPVKDFSSPESRGRAIKTQIAALFKFDRNWPLTRYPFPQLLHSLGVEHVVAQQFALAVRFIALLHYRVDEELYPSKFHPLRLTHMYLLRRMMREVLVAWSPEATSAPDPASVQLSKEINVQTCMYMLEDTMLKDAVQTWTEEPWPWTMKEHEQIRMEDVFGPNADIAATMKIEGGRMEALCTRTLEALKRG